MFRCFGDTCCLSFSEIVFSSASEKLRNQANNETRCANKSADEIESIDICGRSTPHPSNTRPMPQNDWVEAPKTPTFQRILRISVPWRCSAYRSTAEFSKSRISMVLPLKDYTCCGLLNVTSGVSSLSEVNETSCLENMNLLQKPFNWKKTTKSIEGG